MTKKFLRIENDQYEAATTVAATAGRSASQQVNHWVRVGRELEASAGISHLAITRVLETSIGYEELNSLEQAIVRASWAERAIAARESAEVAEAAAGSPVSRWEHDDRASETSVSTAVSTADQDTMA